MALEITKEFATEHGLSEEQVTAVAKFGNNWHDTQLAEEKKGWDGKANTDSQAILDGAAALVAKQTGIEKTDGEKLADYYVRSGSEFLKTKETALAELKADYETKLKDFDGDAGTKEALRVSEEKLDAALKKYANHDELVGYKEKYDTMSTSYSTMKEEVCFGKVEPKFPDTVNTFEADAKWNSFVDGVKKEWNVELVDKVATAINKENPHLTKPLSELVKANEDLTKLMEGRKQDGTGGKEVDLKTVDGVPFPVPKGADHKAITILIREQLAKEGLDSGSPKSAARFKELNDKINQQTV